ncbi:hypothetical protein Hanom_Chr10g00940971 [Helianthus anomalus]
MVGCTSSTTTQISHCRGYLDACFASTPLSVASVAAFECGLKTSLNGRHHLVDLHDFDMVFVPMLEVDHKYLVVGSGVLLRDNETYILKTTSFKVKEFFVDYLKSANHPKETAMQSSVIMREDLPWSTT